MVTLPASGAVTVNSNGTIRYVPVPDFKGQVTFQYTVADAAQVSSNIATVTVNVVDQLFQNIRNPFDVDGDTKVTPLDALLVINEINRSGSRKLNAGEFIPPPFIDVDGNQSVEPLDVLLVINELNRLASVEKATSRCCGRIPMPSTNSSMIGRRRDPPVAEVATLQNLRSPVAEVATLQNSRSPVAEVATLQNPRSPVAEVATLQNPLNSGEPSYVLANPAMRRLVASAPTTAHNERFDIPSAAVLLNDEEPFHAPAISSFVYNANHPGSRFHSGDVSSQLPICVCGRVAE